MFLGVFVPVSLLTYGLLCIINQRAWLPGWSSLNGNALTWNLYTDADAILLGITYCAVGMSLFGFNFRWKRNGIAIVAEQIVAPAALAAAVVVGCIFIWRNVL